MCDTVNTTQNAQFGSHDNSFVAQEINNYGVPVEQVPGMIIDATFKLFSAIAKRGIRGSSPNA